MILEVQLSYLQGLKIQGVMMQKNSRKEINAQLG
jgi:hypothetical protein